MYSFIVSDVLDRKLKKLVKKNRKQYDIIMKKTKGIMVNPHHYKNLRYPLQHLKRLRIDKHFVLLFSVDEKNKRITLEDYDHHDKIY